MRWLSAALLAVAVLWPLPAGAHVELLESDPTVDGQATEGVTSVVLTMAALDPDEPVDVEITDPAGDDVTTGAPRVDARRSTIEVPTRPLEPGQYIVHWHAFADDGDGQSEGTFRFEVTDAPGGGWGVWLIWVVAIAVPAAVLLRPGARRPR